MSKDETQSDEIPVKLPTIKVGWDAEHQGAVMQFDHEEFRSWEMVIAVLEGAVEQAKFNQHMQRIGQLQAMQKQALQSEQIRRNLGM